VRAIIPAPIPPTNKDVAIQRYKPGEIIFCAVAWRERILEINAFTNNPTRWTGGGERGSERLENEHDD